MNAPVLPAPVKPAAAPDRHRRDKEFLPAALEILETPPSPVGVVLMLAISALAIIALTWSYLGHVDIVAIAQGKVQPTGRVKVIEPLVTGRVTAIRVENGRHVEAGALLLSLDATEAEADVQGLVVSLAAARVESARRRAVIRGAEALGESGAAARPIERPSYEPEVPAAIRAREDRVLEADLARLSAELSTFDAQAKEKKAERDRLTSTIGAQRILVATLKERVAMRDALVDLQVGARANVIDALEKAQTQETALQAGLGQLGEVGAALEVVARERAKARDGFLAENETKLAEAERQADELAQKLAKARALASHMSLTSPIAGTVQALAVTTIGQVVTTGEEVMRIVPDGTGLEIEAYLPNKDIGFVKPGQAAAIKVESFPFTRYGTIPAEVTRVARDAIPEPDLRQAEAQAAGGLRQSGLGRAGERMQNLVFPLLVRPGASTIMADGVAVPLSPGMAVTVEIKTGRRRIIEYLFSPLVEVTSDSLKER